MTTIDHQQAAVDSIRMWLLGLGSLTLDEVNDLAPKFVTAATPHLRAAWEQELARAVKRLPWNGVPHGGTMVPLDAVLALLEGGAE